MQPIQEQLSINFIDTKVLQEHHITYLPKYAYKLTLRENFIHHNLFDQNIFKNIIIVGIFRDTNKQKILLKILLNEMV
jgi:hypothetical protein